MSSNSKLKETITAISKKGINIIPLTKITNSQNDKKDFNNALCDFWKNTNTLYSNEYINECIDKNICGFAIATGHFSKNKSNHNKIIVIDWDDKETSNNEILEDLHNTATFTIKTPSGGFHFIFKYNPLFNKNKTEIYGNIDIRTDGGLIFSGIRSDGEYTIYNNNHINEIPNDIIISLLSYNSPKLQKPTKTDKINKISKYDLTDNEILELLNLLPAKYRDSFNEWETITFICNKYDKKEVWETWSKQSTHYNKVNNNKIWATMKQNANDYINSFHYLYFLVKHYNPNINLKPLEKVFYEYEPLTQDNINNAIKINERFLSVDLLNNNKNADIVIKSGTGTAKTTILKKYIKQNEYKLLSIVHLKSLATEHQNIFNKEGIKLLHYKDIKNKSTEEIETLYNGLVIVINSIGKIKHLNFSKHIVYMDEVQALINVLNSSTTIKQRRKIYFYLIKILKECSQIIATDGNIENNTISFLSQLERNNILKFYINEVQANKGKQAIFINDYEQIKELIKDDLKNGKFSFICCNTKKQAENITAFINLNKINNEDVKIYTSLEGKEIKDILTEWDEAYIICSPRIVEGLDFQPKEPINVYCFIFGNTTINPLQVSQQIARNRNPLNTYIYYENDNNKISFKNKTDLIDYYKNIDNVYNNVFFDLVDTKTTFDGVEFVDNPFTLLFYDYAFNQNILMSSFKYHLKEILINKGYEIIDPLYYFENNEKTEDEKRKEVKQIKEIIKQNNNEKLEKYLNNELDETDLYFNDLNEKCEILHFPIIKELSNSSQREAKTDFIKKNIHYLNDKYVFECLKNMFYGVFNNTKAISTSLNKRLKEDFKHIIYKEKSALNLIYKKMMCLYFPKINLYKYEYDESKINIENITVDDGDFNIIVKCLKSRKTTKPINNIELLRLMYFVAKNIYGDKIITSKQSNKREGNKIKSYNIVSFNTKIFNEYLSLYKSFLTTATEDQKAKICPYISKILNGDTIDYNICLDDIKQNIR